MLRVLINGLYIFQTLVTNLITAGHGCEAAFAAAVLGDNALMEKAWQDTGMLAESVLHAHVSTLLHVHQQEDQWILVPILPIIKWSLVVETW